MVSVDSVLQRFLVARVVLGSLSALAFRVIVERQFLHHATATHVRGLQEQPRIPPCHIIRKAANLIIELFNLIGRTVEVMSSIRTYPLSIHIETGESGHGYERNTR